MNLIELYLIFLKIGAQLIGGGYVILPLLKPEFVENKKILTEEELVDYFALSQCIPGIIAVNISLLIGYKVKHSIGAIISLLGLITSPFLIILALANIILCHINNPILQNAFWGIRLSIIILLLLTLQEMVTHSIKDSFSKIMFIIATILALSSFISPAFLIIAGGIIGFIYTKIKGIIKNK